MISQLLAMRDVANDEQRRDDEAFRRCRKIRFKEWWICGVWHVTVPGRHIEV
jgi:hypothetical protein